ncbi:MAG: hypothetical protein FRX48_04090 [Lasallia pustulata]|uniref:Uncharacterized protein n=1 Tax=Lasallia pustulata TaxID=136370 RepID=A0A5M8PSH8_9LECA|nr:MAG: hypothetical protein FRX48_04090 [Lasallia pustulata]
MLLEFESLVSIYDEGPTKTRSGACFGPHESGSVYSFSILGWLDISCRIAYVQKSTLDPYGFPILDIAFLCNYCAWVNQLNQSSKLYPSFRHSIQTSPPN